MAPHSVYGAEAVPLQRLINYASVLIIILL